MIMGWIVLFWPGTTVAMSVSGADESTPVPAGAIFVPESETDGVIPISQPQPETPEQREAARRAELQLLNQLAANQKSALTNRIGVINDAIEFDEATPEEVAELPQRNTQLTAWKRYAVLLGRVTAQPGWYETIDWPIQPTEGMDLGVDPVGRAS